MQVEQWMTRKPRTCRPESSMDEAAFLMWTGDCGTLPVVDADHRLVGMITDRDLCMGAHFQGKPLQELQVRNSMSRSVFSCRTTDQIEEVLRCMGDHRVRRVPILDRESKLVGILSLNDLARHLMALEVGGERERLTKRLIETLAAICESNECGEVPALAEAAIPAAAIPQPSMPAHSHRAGTKRRTS